MLWCFGSFGDNALCLNTWDCIIAAGFWTKRYNGSTRSFLPSNFLPYICDFCFLEFSCFCFKGYLVLFRHTNSHTKPFSKFLQQYNLAFCKLYSTQVWELWLQWNRSLSKLIFIGGFLSHLAFIILCLGVNLNSFFTIQLILIVWCYESLQYFCKH